MFALIKFPTNRLLILILSKVFPYFSEMFGRPFRGAKKLKMKGYRH